MILTAKGRCSLKGRCLAQGLAAFLLSALVIVLPAQAQKLPLVRDAEIEGLIKAYTAPIFRAAGLGKGAVDVYLVNKRSFNAFVTDRRMFIHTGALMEADTPNEIIGVIAHETGHVIGGHQQRLRDRMERAQMLAAVGLLLGAGAMARGGDLGDAAGQALITGGGQSLKRSLLAYKRDEEASADRAAITLLDKTGQSAAGMLRSFERLNEKLLFSSSRIDPYLQSHPLPRARAALIAGKAKSSPNFNKSDPASLQLRHDMMRAKIAAYTGSMNTVRRLFKRNLNGAPARYGLAISQFLSGRSGEALKQIDRLLMEQPKNAYLHEMKAEILLRSGRAAAGIKPMQTAIRLDPYKSGLLRIQYGHLLLETGDSRHLGEAIKQLKSGLARDPSTLSGYEYLARAQARAGNESLAMAATAEQRFLAGQYKDAKRFALRAQQGLKKNSPQWLRLQDIVLYKPAKKGLFRLSR